MTTLPMSLIENFADLERRFKARGASPEKIAAVRRVFFAEAYTVLQITLQIGDVSDEEGVAIIDKMHTECVDEIAKMIVGDMTGDKVQ